MRQFLDGLDLRRALLGVNGLRDAKKRVLEIHSKKSIRRTRVRKLALEALENRQLMAGLLNAVYSTIYEQVPASNPSAPKSTPVVLNYPTDMNVYAGASLKFTISGQVDSYSIISQGFSFTEVNGLGPNTRQLILPSFYAGIGTSIGFEIASTDDETVFNAVDTNDYADDQLVITSEFTYQTSSNVPTAVSATANVTIKDDSTTVNLTLSAPDSSAKEPNNVSYKAAAADLGLYKLDVPAGWGGGVVKLELSGTAILGADFSIAMNSSIAGTTLSNAGANKISIDIPALAGSITTTQSVQLVLTPVADQNEEESIETAVLQFSPTTQQWLFHGASSDLLVAPTGTGTVNVTDLKETLAVSSGSSVKEYAVAPDYGSLKVLPTLTGAMLDFKAAAYFEITVDGSNKARPGNKPGTASTGYTGADSNLDYYLTYPNGAPLILYWVSSSSGVDLYRSVNLAASSISSLDLTFVPFDEKILEGDETAKFDLKTKIGSGTAQSSGSASVTIEEMYLKSYETDFKTAETCSCDCQCPSPTISAQTDLKTGSVTVKPKDVPMSITSGGVNGLQAAILIALPLASDKAVPERIDVSIYLIGQRSTGSTSNNDGTGADTLGVLKSFTIFLDLASPNTPIPGDILWLNVNLDLSTYYSLSNSVSNKNFNGDQVADLRILAHPTFPNSPSPNTNQRYSGWRGEHSTVVVNKASSDPSTPPTQQSGAAPLSIGPIPAVPSDKSTPIGPPALNFFGVKRAIINAQFIQTDTVNDLVIDPVTGVNGAKRVGAAVRYNAKTVFVNGTAVIEPDGTYSTFVNSTTSPYTLSKYSNLTFTDDDHVQNDFDTQGHMIRLRDTNGNATIYAYNDAATGSLMLQRDAFGNEIRFSKISSTATSVNYLATWLTRGATAALPNRTVTIIWSQTGTSSYGNSGTLTIVGIDPDGAGPRKSLTEVYTFANGFLTEASEFETGSSPSSAPVHFTFSSHLSPGTTSAGLGSYVSTITRQDGATRSFETSMFYANAYAVADGTSLYQTTNTSAVSNAQKAVIRSVDARSNPFTTNLASMTDWNGNRTVFKLDDRGRVIQQWDPEQVAAIVRPILGSTVTDTIVNNYIKTMTVMSGSFHDVFNGSLFDDYSYRFTRAASTRNNWGEVSQGVDVGEVIVSKSPIPIPLSQQTPSIPSSLPQTVTYGYADHEDVTSVTQVGLNPTSNVYDEASGIAIKKVDEVRSITQQTVGANNLVTQTKNLDPRSRSVGYNLNGPMDVNDDGAITSLDQLLIINFLSRYGSGAAAPQGPAFYDTNGDGYVTTLDALLVQNALSRGDTVSYQAAYNVSSQTDYTYATTPGLPNGLISERTVTTGRTDLPTDKTVFEYVTDTSTNAFGLVKSITEAAGTTLAAKTSFTYNSLGQLTAVTDPAGRVTTYFYDLKDRLIAVQSADPDGTGPLLSPLIRYDYNAFDSLIAVETINSFIDNSIANSNKLIVTASAQGFKYDSLQRLSADSQQNPAVTWYLYTDATGAVLRTATKVTATAATTVTNAVLTNYARANTVIANNPVTDTTSDGLNTLYTYDFNGNKLNVTQQDGTATTPTSTNRTTEIAYDRLDRPVRVESPNPVSGLATTTTDRRDSVSLGYITTLQYDAIGNLIKVVDGLGRTISFTFDSLNRITRVTEPSVGGPVETNYSYEYTPGGWITTTVDAQGRTTKTRTDSIGRVREVGDLVDGAYVMQNQVDYWTDGQLKSTTNAMGAVTNYGYDLQGRLKSITTPAPTTTGTSSITSFDYSLDDLLKSVTDPMGRVTTFSYNAGGRKIKSASPTAVGAAGPVYDAWAYDSIGNVLTQANATNDPAATAFTASNQPQRFIRDSLGRIIQSTDELGNATSYSYDVFGNTTRVLDASGNETKFAFNALDQLVTETQMVGGTPLSRSYSYDGLGNLRSQVDRNGRAIKYAYDELNRVTSETWYTGTTLNKTLTYGYDRVGNLTGVSDSDTAWGSNFQFAYDTRDQLQLERGGLNSLGQRYVLDRDYDANGNRTKLAANFSGTITVASNLSPIAASAIAGGVNDFVTNYAYDRMDRLVGVSQTSSSDTTKQKNAVAAKQVNFTYNAASQLTDVRRYKSLGINAATAPTTTTDLVVHSRYVYDAAGRLAYLTHAKTEIVAGQAWNGTSTLPASVSAANMLAGYAFAYDRANRITNFYDYSDSIRSIYGYSADDQLTSATSVAIAGLTVPALLPTTESYSFDATGNRKIGTTSTAAAGTHNRISTDGTNNYLYDNEGNIVQKTVIATGRVTLYTWDHRNRLIQVQEKTSVTGTVTETVIYSYDAVDRRTAKRLDADGNGTIDRVWAWISDGIHEILEFEDSDGAGTTQPFRLSNRFLYGDQVDMVLADEQYESGTGPAIAATTGSTASGTNFWTLGDHLGSIRDVVDNNGIVRQHVLFDSFGKRLREVDRDSTVATIASTSAAAIDELFAYTGRDWDADTGLQYNRARWYDPAIGRWMSQDPIGFEGGDANLYRYVENGATNATDPSGRQEKAKTLEERQENLRKKMRSEMEAKGVEEAEIRLRMLIIEALMQSAITTAGNVRDQCWKENKNGFYVPNGTPVTAIKNLTINPKNEVMCNKYSSLILIQGYIRYFEQMNDKEEGERGLKWIDDGLANIVIPEEIPGEGNGIFFREMKGKIDLSSLLPGDQVWFKNPYNDGYLKTRGEEGSNVFYVGDGMVMELYNGRRMFSIQDYPEKCMSGWKSIEPRIKVDFSKIKIMGVRRPLPPPEDSEE